MNISIICLCLLILSKFIVYREIIKSLFIKMLTTLPNAFYMILHDLAAPITTTSMSLFTVPPSSLHSEDQDYCKLWMHEWCLGYSWVIMHKISHFFPATRFLWIGPARKDFSSYVMTTSLAPPPSLLLAMPWLLRRTNEQSCCHTTSVIPLRDETIYSFSFVLHWNSNGGVTVT